MHIYNIEGFYLGIAILLNVVFSLLGYTYPIRQSKSRHFEWLRLIVPASWLLISLCFLSSSVEAHESTRTHVLFITAAASIIGQYVDLAYTMKRRAE